MVFLPIFEKKKKKQQQEKKETMTDKQSTDNMVSKPQKVFWGMKSYPYFLLFAKTGL